MTPHHRVRFIRPWTLLYFSLFCLVVMFVWFGMRVWRRQGYRWFSISKCQFMRYRRCIEKLSNKWVREYRSLHQAHWFYLHNAHTMSQFICYHRISRSVQTCRVISNQRNLIDGQILFLYLRFFILSFFLLVAGECARFKLVPPSSMKTGRRESFILELVIHS